MISNKSYIIYDLDKFTYGSVIIFLEFLNQYKILTNKKLTVFIVNKNNFLREILGLVKKSQLSKRIILYQNFKELFSFYKQNNSKFVQKINRNNFYNYNQNSIIPIQKHFNLKLDLSFKLNFIDKRFLNKNLNVNNKIKVCVNLNFFNKKKVGSAKIKEWKKFFFKCGLEKNLMFYFIGNNNITCLKEFNNIIFLNDYSMSLAQEIKFAQNCHCFIGSASGPSTIFLFSTTPYLIFKHPNHHPKTYKKEILGKKQPKFSCKNQFLLNIFEDEKIIYSYFKRIIKGIKI